MKSRAGFTLLAMLPVLLFSLACGGSGEDEEATRQAAADRAAQNERIERAMAEEEAREAAPSPETNLLNTCMSQCEAQHGPLLNREAMQACIARNGAPAECVAAGMNQAANACQRTCRGLPAAP